MASCSAKEFALGAEEKILSVDEIAVNFETRRFEAGKVYHGTWGGDDWCNFTVKLTRKGDNVFKQVEENLNRIYNENDFASLKSRNLWRYGMPCAVRYPYDNNWYRCLLVDENYKLARFVDYDDCLLRVSEDEVKPLTKSFAQVLPPLYTKCTIADAHDELLPTYTASQRSQTKREISFIPLNDTEPLEVLVVDPDFTATAQIPRPLSPLHYEHLTDEVENPAVRERVIRNTTGKIASLRENVGLVSLVRYPALKCEIRAGITKFNGAVLGSACLRRFFSEGETVRFSAKYENQSTGNADTSGSWIVSDFKVESTNLIIMKGLVSYVGRKACGIAVGDPVEHIWASKSALPSQIAASTRPLHEILRLGSPVFVRALPVESFYDLKIQAHWIAIAVELSASPAADFQIGPVQFGRNEIGIDRAPTYEMPEMFKLVAENISNEERAQGIGPHAHYELDDDFLDTDAKADSNSCCAQETASIGSASNNLLDSPNESGDATTILQPDDTAIEGTSSRDQETQTAEEHGHSSEKEELRKLAKEDLERLMANQADSNKLLLLLKKFPAQGRAFLELLE